jgi:hypothetical protein
MANHPKKMQDPTEAALSAIHSAIADHEAHKEASKATVAEPAVSSPEARRRMPRQVPGTIDEDLFLEEPRNAEPRGTAPRAEEPAPLRRPANDDRQSIGQVLQAIQRRPRRTPYIVATILSFLWLGAAGVVGWLHLPELQTELTRGALNSPVLLGWMAVVLVPIILCYTVAHAAWRSRELRMIAQSMGEVAIRLAEPETVARDSIVSVGQAIRREVAAMGDGVERALARAAELETLVQNEVSALEHAYNDNEIRIRGLLQDLANQRDALVGQAEQVRNAITSVHLDLTNDISAVGERVAETVSASAQQITNMLTDRGSKIGHALAQAGDTMLESLSERGDHLLERLDGTSHQATRAIAAASERLTTSLEFKSDHVHGAFTKLADDLSEAMARRLDGVTDQFAERSRVVVDMMASHSEQLTASIVDAGSEVAETLLARVEEVNTTLRTTGDSLVLDFTLRGGEVVSQLEQSGARVTDTIVSHGDKVTETFRQTAASLAETVEVSGEAVKTLLTSRLQAFEHMFTHGGTELGERIARDSAALGDLITRHLTEFDRTVKTYGGELVERLSQRTQDVSEAMRDYVDGFDRRVSAKADDIGISLDQRLQRFEETLENRTASLNDSMRTRVTEISHALSEGGKDVIAALDQRIGEATGAIDVHSKAASDSLGARMDDISRMIETNAAALHRGADDTEQKLTTLSDNVRNALTTLSTEVTSTLRQNSTEVTNTIRQNSTEITNTIRQNSTEVEQSLLNVSSEVARTFVGKAEEISTAVTTRTDELTKVLDDKGRMLIEALSGKGEQFATEVARATESAVNAIDAKGYTFTRTLTDNSETIARIINDASDNATTAVARSLSELQRSAEESTATAATVLTRTLQDLESSSRSAIEYSKQTASATVSEMLETHSMLRSDTTALFERLREANILLQEVLSGAHENMNSIEHTMVTRVSEFVKTMNELTERSGNASGEVEHHIAQFHTITTRVVADLSQLSGQFDSHGRSLAQAVTLLEESNQRAEDTVAERRAVLDGLVTNLDSRTHDLGERLSRFSNLLDDSLEAAATRARDIARVIADSSVEGQRAVDTSLDMAASRADDIARIIAESSNDGAQAIAANFDRMRAMTEQERTRTVDVMHGIYEQVSGETGQMFRDATERFRDIIGDMKQMALEMKRELETTRGELRRGVLEMPQEASENAAQMRRVIVDQIEALAELNRIVARHGRGFDAAEPVRRGGRDESPAAVAARTETALRPPPVRTERPERQESAAPFTTRRAELPAPSFGNGRNNNNGWLSDLLNRASREPEDGAVEPPREPTRGEDRSPRHSIESLDSLSVDIARMIDHDAASELWDRYKRGERNVFTRRLYTLQGQQAFDEIRKKYRVDGEFKQTVDRYIDEFERLLDEVARDDRGQVVARTYLTSETGKVYTMLAHAAGRFDG